MVARVFTPTARIGDRLFSLFAVRLVVFLLAARSFLPGVLEDPAYKVAYFHDEHGVLVHEEAARKTIAEFHQLPAWNPYYCGGIVELANAPSNAISPDFLLRVIYGTLPGRRLSALLFMLLGMEGTFRFARKNGAGGLGSMLAGIAFSTSAYFVSLLGLGWIFMFHYNLVPWCAVAFELGLRKRWWIVLGGAAMAWIILGGGTYVAPYTAMVLFMLLVNETARAILKLDGAASVRWWKPVATVAAMAAITLALSAIRLFPLLDLLLHHDRPVEQKDFTGPLSILSMLSLPREHASWGAGAGDFYVGTITSVVAVFALLFGDKKAAKFWVIALLFAAFACGEFVPNAPYTFMRRVPVLSQLRFPVRMVTICALFVALAAAMGVTRIEDLLPRLGDLVWARLRHRFGAVPPSFVRVLVAALAFGVGAVVVKSAATEVVETNKVHEGSVYTLDPPLVNPDPYGFRQSRGNRWDANIFPYANLGSLHCFEEHQLFESPYLRGDLAQEEYGAPETGTVVERLKWSPHEIVVRVTSPGPGRFLVNQNHADAWKTNVGELGSEGGLISVKVPAGEHVVTLVYSDWKVRLGALVTFTTVLVIAFFGVKALLRVGSRLRRLWKRLPEQSR